jgi:hypothetical protein
MLKNLQNNIVLWVQSRTGLSGGFLISLAVAGGAALLTFVFLCVTGYAWLSIQLGPVFGGLAMAGLFLLIAVIGAAASALSRRQIRQRAIVERAARAKGPDRSESAERRDAGGPCARLAAADSVGLARLSRRAMGAGSAARRHAPIGLDDGLIATQAVVNFIRYILRRSLGLLLRPARFVGRSARVVAIASQQTDRGTHLCAAN